MVVEGTGNVEGLSVFGWFGDKVAAMDVEDVALRKALSDSAKGLVGPSVLDLFLLLLLALILQVSLLSLDGVASTKLEGPRIFEEMVVFESELVWMDASTNEVFGFW